ncbi:MAG: CapA family protein, partial [Leptotrichiaceae bacterium]|nr:CapA family protein [Leptotrichiaceae bacterium]
MKEKKIILFLIFILLVSISCGDKKNSNSTEKNSLVENTTSSSSNNADSNKKQEITIVGVGDIMLGSNYPNKSLLPNENILKNTESILKDADITVGNLEGTLFDSGGTPKSCSNPKVCYVFRTPSSYGKYFKEAGFDYLSIANNHSNDFGHKGIEETIKNLDLLEIKHTGIKDLNEWSILEKDGIKYGFISFAPNNKTVKLNDYEYAKNLIKSTKDKVDILVVMFHGG